MLHTLTKRTTSFTAQKVQFFIKDFVSKWGQIHSFLRIWSHLLKKSLIENFIFCSVFLSHCKLHPNHSYAHQFSLLCWWSLFLFYYRLLQRHLRSFITSANKVMKHQKNHVVFFHRSLVPNKVDVIRPNTLAKCLVRCVVSSKKSLQVWNKKWHTASSWHLADCETTSFVYWKAFTDLKLGNLFSFL